jgi:hypothetical protein
MTMVDNPLRRRTDQDVLQEARRHANDMSVLLSRISDALDILERRENEQGGQGAGESH